MQNIVDNTDKLAKLLSESNKSKQTNSSKRLNLKASTTILAFICVLSMSIFYRV